MQREVQFMTTSVAESNSLYFENDLVAGLVSVVIPVYNRVDFIEETIRSVITQDYPSIELIVVDDGSTDGSYQLLLELKSQFNFTLITHQDHKNFGQSASINLGMSISSGEFIAILDSDDLFLPEKITLQINEFDKDPKVDLIYGLGTAIDAEGNYLYDILREDHKESNDPNAVLLDCYFLLPQNSLARRSVYEKVGSFDENLRAAQDHDMLVRMAEVANFKFVPKYFFKYRRHSNSISSKGAIKRWESGFKILNKARKRYPYRITTIRKRLAVLCFRLGSAFMDERKSYLYATFLLFSSAVLDPVRAANVILRIEKVS